MPYIFVGRSDLEEHDVAASSNHLNERAEERKEENNEHRQQEQQEQQEQQQQQRKDEHNHHHQKQRKQALNSKEDSDFSPSALAQKEEPWKETAVGGVQRGEDKLEVLKQPSLIQAERTDDKTWDAMSQGESGRGWCARLLCLRRHKAKKNQIS